MTPTRSARIRLVLLAVAAAMLLPAAAQAYWRGGVFFAFPPIYVAPPPAYYYPPPAYYYPPPPAYGAPPSAYAAPPDTSSGPPAPAQACYAGPWVCSLDRATASGDSCSCAANGGRVWGRAR
jgi:hypothetical protein